MTANKRALIQQFEIERQPSGAVNELPLHDAGPAANVIDQHLLVGAQEPTFARPSVDSTAYSAAINDARIRA